MDALDLVANIRSGGDARKSQEELYPIVRAAVLSRIEKRIGPQLRPRIDPEDILHEAFMRAMKALDLFEPRSERAFFAWIFTIAKNLLADHAKRRSVGAVHLAMGSEQAGPRASQVEGGVRRPESLMQRSDWLETLLKRLNDKEAEVIRMRRIDCLSIEQIAVAWGKSPDAVQRFYSRAWKKLRELSADAGEA